MCTQYIVRLRKQVHVADDCQEQLLSPSSRPDPSTGGEIASPETSVFSGNALPVPSPLQSIPFPLPPRVTFLSCRKMEGPVRLLPSLTNRRARIASEVAGRLS